MRELRDDERVTVGTTGDGRDVYAVKRDFGPFAARSYGECCGTHYWTVIVQTMPGKAKTMAVGRGKRFYGGGDADDRRAAVAWAETYLRGEAWWVECSGAEA
ncbi:MAG TPA: hypothetical protein VHH11_13860 [Gammaproteobacteria bacterium]|nr:hypothetical protein [Gammaproteobacteria bacterium]